MYDFFDTIVKILPLKNMACSSASGQPRQVATTENKVFESPVSIMGKVFESPVSIMGKVFESPVSIMGKVFVRVCERDEMCGTSNKFDVHFKVCFCFCFKTKPPLDVYACFKIIFSPLC